MVESLTITLTHRMPPTLLLFHDLQTVLIPEVMGESVATLARAFHRRSPSADFLIEALYHRQHQALARTVVGAGLHYLTAMGTGQADMEDTTMHRAQLA